MEKILAAIQQYAQKTPEQTALCGSESVLSYAQLNHEVEALAASFIASGWRRMAMMLDNGPAWVIIDLATAKAGISLVPLPAFFSDQQLKHSLADAGIEVLLTDQPGRFSSPEQLDAGHNPIAGTAVHYLHVSSQQECTPLPVDTVKITYTSGTTGSPKGVCLNGEAIDTVSHSLVQRSQITADDVHLCLLPLATLLENIAGIYVPLLAGATVAVPSLAEVGMLGASGVDMDLLVNTMRKQGTTRAILLPQLLQALIETLEAGATKPDQLRFLAVGGAPLSPQLLQRAEKLGLPLYQGYGLSECCSVVALNNSEHNHPGSVGQPLPHIEINFAEDGEIMVNGALFSGYLGDEQKRAIEWWPSGDLGYLDDEGYLFITGRKKNIFITSFGRNVAPEWVEQELVLHPAIKQAFVSGEARPWNIAILVSNVSDEQLQQAVDETNTRLPDYARIRHWLKADAPFSVNNEQLTATGRLRRQTLMQYYGEQIEKLYAEHKHLKETGS